MIQKSVIIICRSESLEDFNQIARRAHRLDPTVAVIAIPEQLHSSLIPKALLNLPMLVIFLVNPPEKEFHLAGKMAVKHMTKLEEYEHFKKHNIPCLPIEAFTWGMTLDKSIYGDWVVLKPQTIQSTGKDVNMVPTNLIPKLTLDDFPEDHLIRQDQYYVQKFIKTGERPVNHRVLVFLGRILLTIRFEQHANYSEANTLNLLLGISVASNLKGDRDIDLIKDERINNFAIDIARSFPDLPLLGIDIIPDMNTQNLFVIEVNSGGNTWAFSSNVARNVRELMGRKTFLEQYNAWDQAAEALIKKAHALAN